MPSVRLLKRSVWMRLFIAPLVLLSAGLCHREERVRSAPLVIAGALLPDADILIEPFLHPQSGFVHRGFTHSLLGVAVLAPLAALVALLLFRAKGYARLVALIAIGMLSPL
jgi:membrane-bound metal-dependent hydrolase YbcI (DUF457 family)